MDEFLKIPFNLYNTKANSADNAEKTVENSALAANKWCSRDLNSCLARPLQLIALYAGQRSQA